MCCSWCGFNRLETGRLTDFHDTGYNCMYRCVWDNTYQRAIKNVTTGPTYKIMWAQNIRKRKKHKKKKKSSAVHSYYLTLMLWLYTFAVKAYLLYIALLFGYRPHGSDADDNSKGGSDIPNRLYLNRVCFERCCPPPCPEGRYSHKGLYLCLEASSASMSASVNPICSLSTRR